MAACLALLVDGALICDESDLPEVNGLRRGSLGGPFAARISIEPDCPVDI